MRYILTSLLLAGICFFSVPASGAPFKKEKKAQTIVDRVGHIQVKGNKLIAQNGDPVALHGMSLFWSQWGGEFYNRECIQWLRDDWNCTVVRAVCGIREDGYLAHPEAEMAKITSVIDACIDLGMYVIVDWHDHVAENHMEQSKEFFKTLAIRYGHTPNIIYEIYNEPLKVSWNTVVRPYAAEILSLIRKSDPDNLVIVGTPHWSQDVDSAAVHPILDTNIAYAFHFYSSDYWHKQNLRNKALDALKKGLPLFITEYGVTEANGDGRIDTLETENWFSFIDQHSLSTCNWSISGKRETSSAFIRKVSPHGMWNDSDLSVSGRMVRHRIRRLNKPLFDALQSKTE